MLPRRSTLTHDPSETVSLLHRSHSEQRERTSDRNNYFVVELPEALPIGFEYWIFFNVRGAAEPDAVLLFVQSAYAGDTREVALQPTKGKGSIQNAGVQGPGRAAVETIALKNANPATGAGFVCRSSWLSHSWCGPFRAGRRGFGYCVTGVL